LTTHFESCWPAGAKGGGAGLDEADGVLSASEQRGNKSKPFQDFHLKYKALTVVYLERRIFKGQQISKVRKFAGQHVVKCVVTQAQKEAELALMKQMGRRRSLSLSHTLTDSLSHTHTLTDSLSHTQRLSLSHVHTLTYSLSLSHTHTHTLTLQAQKEAELALMKQMGRRRAPGKKAEETKPEDEDAKPQEVAHPQT